MSDVRAALDERLEQLEALHGALGRECRRWRLGAAGLALTATVFVLAGANQRELTPRTLTAQNFVLRDELGRTRASLGFRPDGTPGLALMDDAARVRLALDLGTDGAPGVNFYDADGTLQAALAIRSDASPGLGFFDSGKLRLSLDLGPKRSAPGLSLYDRRGTMRAAMAVRPDETPGVGLFNAQGHPSLSLEEGTDVNSASRRANTAAATR